VPQKKRTLLGVEERGRSTIARKEDLSSEGENTREGRSILEEAKQGNRNLSTRRAVKHFKGDSRAVQKNVANIKEKKSDFQDPFAGRGKEINRALRGKGSLLEN